MKLFWYFAFSIRKNCKFLQRCFAIYNWDGINLLQYFNVCLTVSKILSIIKEASLWLPPVLGSPKKNLDFSLGTNLTWDTTFDWAVGPGCWSPLKHYIRIFYCCALSCRNYKHKLIARMQLEIGTKCELILNYRNNSDIMNF